MRSHLKYKLQKLCLVASLVLFATAAHTYASSPISLIEDVYITDTNNQRLSSVERGQIVRLWVKYRLPWRAFVTITRSSSALDYFKKGASAWRNPGERTSYTSAVVPCYAPGGAATYRVTIEAVCSVRWRDGDCYLGRCIRLRCSNRLCRRVHLDLDCLPDCWRGDDCRSRPCIESNCSGVLPGCVDWDWDCVPDPDCFPRSITDTATATFTIVDNPCTPTPIIESLKVVDARKNQLTELRRGQRAWIDVTYWVLGNARGSRMKVTRRYEVPAMHFTKSNSGLKRQGRYRSRKMFIVASNYPDGAGPIDVTVTIKEEFPSPPSTPPTSASETIQLPVVGPVREPWAEVVSAYVTDTRGKKVIIARPGQRVQLHIRCDVFGFGDLTRRYRVDQIGYRKETVRGKYPGRFHSYVTTPIPNTPSVYGCAEFVGSASMSGGGNSKSYRFRIWRRIIPLPRRDCDLDDIIGGLIDP